MEGKKGLISVFSPPPSPCVLITTFGSFSLKRQSRFSGRIGVEILSRQNCREAYILVRYQSYLLHGYSYPWNFTPFTDSNEFTLSLSTFEACRSASVRGSGILAPSLLRKDGRQLFLLWHSLPHQSMRDMILHSVGIGRGRGWKVLGSSRWAVGWHEVLGSSIIQ